MKDKVLLKIRRRFSKDESFKFVLDELSKAKYSNGELKSENSELKYENNKLKKQINQTVKLTKEDLKEQRFIELNKKIHSQAVANKRLLDDVNTWRAKYFQALHELEKLSPVK